MGAYDVRPDGFVQYGFKHVLIAEIVSVGGVVAILQQIDSVPVPNPVPRQGPESGIRAAAIVAKWFAWPLVDDAVKALFSIGCNFSMIDWQAVSGDWVDPSLVLIVVVFEPLRDCSLSLTPCCIPAYS